MRHAPQDAPAANGRNAAESSDRSRGSGGGGGGAMPNAALGASSLKRGECTALSYLRKQHWLFTQVPQESQSAGPVTHARACQPGFAQQAWSHSTMARALITRDERHLCCGGLCYGRTNSSTCCIGWSSGVEFLCARARARSDERALGAAATDGSPCGGGHPRWARRRLAAASRSDQWAAPWLAGRSMQAMGPYACSARADARNLRLAACMMVARNGGPWGNGEFFPHAHRSASTYACPGPVSFPICRMLAVKRCSTSGCKILPIIRISMKNIL